ncbi:DNA-binding transcriptional LysR family regulator [Novosphingobium chloroacetimidivorans]|uniref:DNA-binding transcriptional LysR family regulator n=1 Tax=Novosphingobium chloroacetimidivorans TaxID=1428314 RepID=A0A7W7NVV4_9SPHN|nr:LysR family transcriptional regulator [Novosphingobium chloroacetimidivorans]MBB4858681.1 DNA-binding transcriptional LysR family regulator [Novosphingobium chloroacetimidivorans]
MTLNGFRYLLALDRERHFARAAQACGVSQPSLSAGLATLEQQLGRRLVARDRRFLGLTAEGRAVLPWARQVVAAMDGLMQAAETASGPLRGDLRLGVIPAAQPIIGAIAAELHQRHPEVRLACSSLTSREIGRGLEEYALDAGISYLEHEPLGDVISVPLYREGTMFVAAEPMVASFGKAATLDEALAVPLCLLHQGMQNRRILDANLAASGRSVRPAASADSYVALLAMVSTGTFATLMPDSYVPLLPSWARIIPLAEPLPESAVGLIVPERRQLSLLAATAISIAEHIHGQARD